MKKLTDSELISEILINNIGIKTGLKLKEPTHRKEINYWITDQIELLLNCYPILRKFNYKAMGLEEVQALVQQLSEYLDVVYSEEDDLVFVDLTEMTGLFSLKELIMWFVISALLSKSYIHFKFNQNTFDTLKVREAHAIDYLCDNSYLTLNNSTNEYHFLFSLASMISSGYRKKDLIINTLISIKRKHNDNLTLSTYVKNRGLGQNIDIDPNLKLQSRKVRIKI